MKIHISKGNSKLGDIPNLSLPPIKTCAKKLPCYKKCYAKRCYKQYPATRKNWDENLKLWNKYPNRFADQLHRYLLENTPDYFRFHVGGDIPSQAYFDMMCDVAMAHQGTKFLAFTKRYGLQGMRTPTNLSLIFSRWPGGCVPEHVSLIAGSPCNVRQAWLYNPKQVDVYMPKTGLFGCPGSCKTCKYCWNGDGDVKFTIH